MNRAERRRALREVATAGGRDIGTIDTAYRGKNYFVTPGRDGKNRIHYEAQRKQDELHQCTAPNVLFGGAAGGGKSHALRWHGILACQRRRGLKVLLLRRQHTELEKTHLIELPRELPPEVASYHGTLKRLTFHRGGQDRADDSILQFGHCRHEKDIGSYLSTQWDMILIDEASEFTPRMLSMLQSRLRTKLSGIRPQLVLASNPGGEAHLWLVSRFIDKKVDPEEDGAYDPKDYAFIASKVGDNKHNDASYLQRLLSLPLAQREAYLYGNWTAFAGQYFREWSASLHKIPASREGLEDWYEVQAGMDWGYDPHPGVVLWSAFDSHGRCTVYKELKFNLSSPREVAEMIVARCESEAERRMTIYGDTQMWERNPSNEGVSIADEINEAFADLGTQIVLAKANKDRINGWMRVHQFLDPRRPSPEGGVGPYLRVMEVGEGNDSGLGAPFLIATLPAQRHSDKQDGDMNTQGNDHACDALRYLLMSRAPLSLLPLHLRPGLTAQERVKHRTRKLLAKAAENRRQAAAVLELEGEDSLEVDDLPFGSTEADEDDDLSFEGAAEFWS